MWFTAAKLLLGKAIVEYLQTRRAVNRNLEPAGNQTGWLLSGEEDTPKPHKDDLPDDEGAKWLRGLESSKALRRLGYSYRHQPILGTVADED